MLLQMLTMHLGLTDELICKMYKKDWTELLAFLALQTLAGTQMTLCLASALEFAAGTGHQHLTDD